MAVLLQDVDNVVLVFGEYLGEAVRFFDGLRRLRRSCSLSPNPVASRMFVPSPSCFAVSRAMANWSPVTILTFTPICCGARDGCFGLLARRIEQRQHADKLPLIFLIRPGHAQGTEAAPRKFVDGFLDGGLYFAGVGRHLQNDLRRSLGHKELFSVRSL